MDNVTRDQLHIERVKNALTRLDLIAEVYDDGKFIHIKLDDGKAFEVSHVFISMANAKVLDKRVAFGAGMGGAF